jgi:hypothetical protein
VANLNKTLILLQGINQFLGEVNPLIGPAIALGTLIVGQIKGSEDDTGDFATEIAKFDALVNSGLAADAQWRKDHGLPSPPA